jgi:5-methylcytosine-specific restriction endonuclease McrA
MSKAYCCYCGRVAHRCDCEKVDSGLQKFLARANPVTLYKPCHQGTPYKRGVPPQVKRRERLIANRNRDRWYQRLVNCYGDQCQHCGTNEEKQVLDHVLPIAKGGRSVIENMQLLCATCNRLKGKLVYDCRPFAYGETK